MRTAPKVMPSVFLCTSMMSEELLNCYLSFEDFIFLSKTFINQGIKKFRFLVWI